MLTIDFTPSPIKKVKGKYQNLVNLMKKLDAIELIVPEKEEKEDAELHNLCNNLFKKLLNSFTLTQATFDEKISHYPDILDAFITDAEYYEDHNRRKLAKYRGQTFYFEWNSTGNFVHAKYPKNIMYSMCQKYNSALECLGFDFDKYDRKDQCKTISDKTKKLCDVYWNLNKIDDQIKKFKKIYQFCDGSGGGDT